MNRPPLRDAAVVIDGGAVLDLGDAAAMSRKYPAADHEDLGDALLLPGLVNAHAHLELSDMTAVERKGSFADWILSVIAARQSMGALDGTAAASAARTGAIESLRFGVTTVGDVTGFPAHTRPALADSPLRVVSFGEVRAMAGRRELLAPRLAEATDLRYDGRGRLEVAVSPHAPYSVEPEGYRACLAWAKANGRPITTHLAETPDEAVFLAEHGGPLMRIWDVLGDWRPDVPTFSGGPVRFAKSLGLLDSPTLLAHMNYVDDDELDLLAGGPASVVWCPRTHAYFGHEPHRFREMLARGVNVCVGTDSRASSPDLNVISDLRLIRRQYPDVPAATLWEMVTTRPAAALGVADRVGSLKPGAWADAAAFAGAGRSSDPLATVLDGDAAPSHVYVAGNELGRQAAP